MARLTMNESPFQVTLKGVAAGLVGTLVMTSALQVVGRLMSVIGQPPNGQPAWDEPTPPDTADTVPPTEQVAERLATRVFGTELSHETRQRLGSGIYWAYGCFWGALSAQIQLTLRPPALAYGVGMGLAVWLVGPARLVPALRLYARPASAGLAKRLIAIGLHILYGVTTALTLERLSADH